MFSGVGEFVNDHNVFFFRPPMLLAGAWFLWGLNVFIFIQCDVDFAGALRFERSSSSLSPAKICGSAVAMLGGLVVLWVLYTLRWPFADRLAVPSLMYAIAIFLLIFPGDVLHKEGRYALLRNLYRVAFPSATGVAFVEVVLGDILTSLSKALADLQGSLCVLLSEFLGISSSAASFEAEILAAKGEQILSHENILRSYEDACAESWMRPIVTSLPFLLRFRQCIVAYYASGEAFPHLVNAAKYASAFPVIWISTFGLHFPNAYGNGMRRLWIFAISFNSFFSFMWDVVMDWGLSSKDSRYFLLREKLLFISEDRLVKKKESIGRDLAENETPEEVGTEVDPEEGESNKFLDRHPSEPVEEQSSSMVRLFAVFVEKVKTFFRNMVEIAKSPSFKDSPSGLSTSTSLLKSFLPSTPILYYIAIVVDFLLRVLWSFKLSVHLHLTQDGLTFVLEIFEILRRSLWLLFRIEWETIQQEERRTRRQAQFDSDPETEGKKEDSPSSKVIWSGNNTHSRGPIRARLST